MTISEIETACGVTPEAVRRVLSRSAQIGQTLYLPEGTGPALGGAAARQWFKADAEFSHISKVGGYPAYRKSS